MNFQCPICKENLELPFEIVEGQHVRCPYCNEKFAYGDDQLSGAKTKKILRKKQAEVLGAWQNMHSKVCNAIDAVRTTIRMLRTRHKSLIRVCILTMLCLGVYCVWLEVDRVRHRVQFGGLTLSLSDDELNMLKMAEGGDPKSQYKLAKMLHDRIPDDADKCGLPAMCSFEWAMKSAEKGCCDGENFVGWCYYDGFGVKVDYEKAVLWYEKAVAHGSDKAMANLAVCYEDGHGVKQDMSKAHELARKSALNGDPKGEHLYGFYLVDGITGHQDKKQGIEWLKKSIEHGEEGAKWLLANCYEHGDGVEKNLQMAKSYYKALADRGNYYGMRSLARIECSSKDAIERRHGLDLCRRVIEVGDRKGIAGDGSMEALLGLRLWEENATGQAYEYLKRGANKGMTPAMVALARGFLNGAWPGGVDELQAMQWIRRAADNDGQYEEEVKRIVNIVRSRQEEEEARKRNEATDWILLLEELGLSPFGK